MISSDAQWLTLWFVLLVTAAVLGYDLAVIRWSGPDASISRVLGRLLEHYPSASARPGFLVGDSGRASLAAGPPPLKRDAPYFR